MTVPKVCFLGHEQLGSWKIRGEQMSAQRAEWHATTELTQDVLDSFEVFCVVKHFKPGWLKTLRSMGKIVFVDIVDGWIQPEDNLLVKNQVDAIALFSSRWKKWQFTDGFIFPTKAMREDLGAIAPTSCTIYHHFRPGIKINPIRPVVKKVGYEGKEISLSIWRNVLEKYCEARGLDFVVNPGSLAELDIGIAVRGREHDSYLTRRYKSNVKLANFYGSGTPCIMQHGQSAYHETDCGKVLFFKNAEELVYNLDVLRRDHSLRQSMHEAYLDAALSYSIDRMSDEYEEFFSEVMERKRTYRTAYSFLKKYRLFKSS